MIRRTAHSAAAAVALAALGALALPIASLAAPAASAAPGDEVTWGVRTADTDLGEGRENYSYTVEPGGEVSDAFVVSNYDDVPLELAVYAADGFTTEAGELDVLPRDETSSEVGVWVTPASDRIVVDPGASVEVPFTVSVPETATPGDYAGAVLTSLSTPSIEDGIQVDRRLGIRIQLRVEGQLAPQLELTGMSVAYADPGNPFATGTATVTYTVRNTGNTRLAAGQTIEVAGPFGWFPREATIVEPVPQLLPGETWQVTSAIDGVVPAIWLDARAELHPRLTDADAGVAVAPVRGTAGGWAVPWMLIAGIALLAALVAGALLLRRRAVAARAVAEQERVDAAVAEALRQRDAVAAP